MNSKTLRSALVGAVALLTLAGCGGNNDSPSTPKVRNAVSQSTQVKAPSPTTTKPVAAPPNAAKYVVKNGIAVITMCNAGYILSANQCIKATITTAKATTTTSKP